MIILTNDPSMGAWGWAIVQSSVSGDAILDSGCIKTAPDNKKNKIRKADDRVRRLNEIVFRLQNIVKKYEVQWILTELPHGSQNASAAYMIGAVAGLLAAFAKVNGLPIEWYSENDAKKHLINKKSVSKKETINCIIKHYGEGWCTGTKYIDEAVADCLSIYHVAKAESSALIYALKSEQSPTLTRRK